MTFDPVIQLSSLDGSNGFRLDGELRTDRLGYSVSGAGDINGDGIDDLIIGAPRANGNNNGNYSGSTYVVFGSTEGFDSTFDLSSLDGSNGFRLNGQSEYDQSGSFVSSAGDINGDGIDDLIIGTSDGESLGNYSGSSYVVFGSTDGFNSNIDLSSLDGNNGFRLNTQTPDDSFRRPVSSAGDINGDGIDDLIIGAPRANNNGSFSGSSYVVFGTTEGFDSTFDLKNLDGSNGFRLDGESESDDSGFAVSSAGDINGDGIDDLIIGAPRANNNGSFSGSSYVVFGSTKGFDSTFDLASLDGSNGFRLDGESESDASGWSVSDAGDINGDGIDDLIIGAIAVDNNGSFSGSSYVVFGTTDGFDSTFDLDSLDGSNGFRLDGEAAADFSGISVSGAGDINGDGIDDLIIGANRADNNGNESGSTYVVFGSTDGFDSNLDLGNLNGSNGFRLDGQLYDLSGFVVSDAGDINGDGIDDLIIGAFAANSSDINSGSSYVVFGRASNQDPVANDDSFTANQDTALTIPIAELLANDADSDGDNLTITAITNPNGGTVILDNSNVIFIPDAGFSGTASFEYTLDDGNGGLDSATVTVEVGKNITGSNRGDTIDGTNGNDIINAGNGHDTVNGFEGDDLLNGGNGKDLLDGGDGNDIILGGNSQDTLFGSAGDDTIDGGNGVDELTGGLGNDILNGGNGADELIGDWGNDILTGGNGADELSGGLGNDTLSGDNGADELTGGLGNDTLSGGKGADKLTGGLGNDTLSGGNGRDLFIFAAGDGTDIITDFRGVDRIGLLNGLTFNDLNFSGSDIIVNATNEVLVTLTGVDTTTLTASDFVVI
ncbi:MAG: hypothetical protein F6K47_25840 [Symploca sp. SIO2E6]|nr:hypothetical protein [Symploca sp. SIO2E6]